MSEAYDMQEDTTGAQGGEADPKATGPMHALDMIEMENIADHIQESVLNEIGHRVIREAASDKATMEEWLAMNATALELIEQKYEPKSEPFNNASSTKLPLVLDAIMRAHAEEMPEIIRDDELVRAKVFGRVTPEKEARAERVTRRMNYHWFYGMPNWEEDHDKMVLHKNTLGTVHKKSYWCAEEGRFKTELRTAGVIINDGVEHLEEAARITDEMSFRWWEVEEKYRAGIWTKQDLQSNRGLTDAESDKVLNFYEQLRREDLDEDGYPEPYVITVHKESGKVVRIAANYTHDAVMFREPPKGPQDRPPVVKIDQTKGRIHYTKYEMIPSFSGGYWGWGFGRILGPMNDNCNALVNQLIDAGTLANSQSGFLSSALRIGKGEVKFQRGEWKTVNAVGGVLRDSVFPLPARDPSPTLFNLLGTLMEVLRQTSGISQLMSGEEPKANAPAASTLALLEQGKKALGQLYKRHRRAIKKEAQALFTLCGLYEDPQDYAAFFDEPEQDDQGQKIPPPDPQADFNMAGMDLAPTAQPEFSTRVQRIAQSEALMKVSGDPRVNGGEILRTYVENVTNDRELAARIVPSEPNITPEQMLQKMEMAKKEILNTNEVKISQAQAEIAALELEMKKIDASQKGITAPMAVAKAEHGALRSSLQVEAAAIGLQTADANLDLLKAKVANERAQPDGDQS